jgi:hypothetical protein
MVIARHPSFELRRFRQIYDRVIIPQGGALSNTAGEKTELRKHLFSFFLIGLR